jgi:phosphoribosylanthranilate isomerase
MAAKIKICGIMRPDEGAFAVAAGASYLGVVFAEGPRTVSARMAREIVAAAGSAAVMGVFTDQSVDQILQIHDQTGLSGTQLHGAYSSASAARLRGAGLEVWRVVRIAVPADLDLLSEAVTESNAVLVEPKIAHVRGGGGFPLDLAVAREARSRLAGHPMVLAGGLTAETVSEALVLVRPEIVDVSSGVERLPGVKDLDKIARFAEAVFAHSPVS